MPRVHAMDMSYVLICLSMPCICMKAPLYETHPFMVCEEQRMVLSPVAWSNALPLLVCIVCLGPGSALHRMWRGDHTSRELETRGFV